MTQFDQELLNRLFLVRHGESTCNTVHRIAGTQDAPLTLMGKFQAAKIAKRPLPEGLDRVYVSPLYRASETANLIFGDESDDTAIERRHDSRLMERDFGSFTLESKSLLQRKHGIAEYERAMNGDSPLMKGGETFAQFRNRVRAFFDNELIPALREGHTVCVVSHKYVVELICGFILGRPDEEAYDLRLPNSQLLRGSNIHRYVQGESKRRNMAYDWIVVNHPLVICVGLLLGLLANAFGLRVHPSPYVLLALLIVAGIITMCRIEVESARSYLTDRVTIRTVLIRYVGLPAVAALPVHWIASGPIGGDLACAIIIFAAPSSIAAMTVSRCLAGMIMPSFAYVVLASAASAISFSVVLGLALHKQVVLAIVVSVLSAAGSICASYLIVRYLRRRTPIRTAKFGERNAWVAVILLTAFAALSATDVPLSSIDSYGLVAVGIMISLRLVSRLLTRHRAVQSIDDYVSMSYPNIFVVVVTAMLTGDAELSSIATWCLLPMFVFSFFDSWYTLRLAIPPEDPRWRKALNLRNTSATTTPIISRS